MSDVRTTLTIYSDTLTADEFETLMGPDWMSKDDIWELDWGVCEAADEKDRRWLYWQGNHSGWLNEEEKISEILELRSDIVGIEWRQEDNDANYDDVISATVYTRDSRVHFTTQLVPVQTLVMVKAIRDARRQGNEHAAWLAVEHLLAGIEKGASL